MSEEYNKKYKVNDLSSKEIADLLWKCFYKIGIKPEPTPEDLKEFISEVRKWQGNIPIDIFEHSFSLLQAGEIEVEDKRAFTPWYVSRVIRAQRVKAFGPSSKTQRVYSSFDTTDGEAAWSLYLKRLKFYGKLDPGADFIKIFNYLVSKGHITNAHIIDKWDHKLYAIAMEDVTAFTRDNYSHLLHEDNSYAPPGNVGEKVSYLKNRLGR